MWVHSGVKLQRKPCAEVCTLTCTALEAEGVSCLNKHIHACLSSHLWSPVSSSFRQARERWQLEDCCAPPWKESIPGWVHQDALRTHADQDETPLSCVEPQQLH